jgi:hypothetical protein
MICAYYWDDELKGGGEMCKMCVTDEERLTKFSLVTRDRKLRIIRKWVLLEIRQLCSQVLPNSLSKRYSDVITES